MHSPFFRAPYWLTGTLVALSIAAPAQILSEPIAVTPTHPAIITCSVEGSLLKTVLLEVYTPSDYAHLSLYAGTDLLLDQLDIPSTGNHTLSALVQFASPGDVRLEFRAADGDLTINQLRLEDFEEAAMPRFTDISEKAGLDRVNTIKYGGPCIADIDQDGDYDFIVTNHNDETNKLYWNQGDGTVKRHDQNLSRWRLEDLHGVSCADYDNDGDLDILQTKGGGNGKVPSLPDFYRNDQGKLVLVTMDAGITLGARGRGARWSDMDRDGDLDLVLINARGLADESPQHTFYRNRGDGTFEPIRVANIDDADAQRALVTDVNHDGIDDFILYDPTNTLWLGNGDFTFTQATDWFPEGFSLLDNMMGATDIDIDNDGDFDLYFARGNAFGVGEKPSFNFCPVHLQLDIKIRNEGSFELALEAEKDIDLHHYDFVGRNGYKGEEFPIYLGSSKQTSYLNRGGRIRIDQTLAEGWPEDISGNGIYFGYTGNGNWRSAVVINGQIFWNVGFTLDGVKHATPEFIRLNANPPDVLLRNDGDHFTEVSKAWNVPQYGNHSGVTVADFNNDGFTDLFLHRWGTLLEKPSDYLLINTGQNHFEPYTAHGARDTADQGHGDMGQAFDFDLDGDIDLLNGSDEYGMWYLYENQSHPKGNYALVRVGYSPQSHVDAMAAEVVLKTPQKEYRKRVGSSGEVFSQSLLNIVHFGLGNEEAIEQITITWRNGEQVIIADKKANRLFDTDKLDPVQVQLDPSQTKIRQGTSLELKCNLEPTNANPEVIWSSSNESICRVDPKGLVTATGKPGKKATITATCQANGLMATASLEIVKWHEVPVEYVTLTAHDTIVYTGKAQSLSAIVTPKYADHQELVWTSSNEAVARVDQSGVVTGIAEGKSCIKIRPKTTSHPADSLTLTVKTHHEPGLHLKDSLQFTHHEFQIGDTLQLEVSYSAGSGNKVVSQDLGGLKYMFRQMKNHGMMARDYTVLVDSEVLGTESGTSSAIILLDDVVPSSELPEGNFYYLSISIASSNGEVYSLGIYPIKVTAPDNPTTL